MLKKLGLSALVLVLTLLAMEGAARALVDPGGLPDMDWQPHVLGGVERRATVHRDETGIKDLGYDLRPNASGSVVFPFGPDPEQAVTIEYAINSLGIRDREYAVPKPDGHVRICVVGDSFTYGLGVQAHETYPKAMERAFAERFPGATVEVLNCGVFNYNAREIARFLHGRVLDFEPDLVLFCFMVNDCLLRNNYRTVKLPDGSEQQVVLKNATERSPAGRVIDEWALNRRPGSTQLDDGATAKQRRLFALRRASRLVDWLALRRFQSLKSEALFVEHVESFNPEKDSWKSVERDLRVVTRQLQERRIPMQMTWIPAPLDFADGEYRFMAQHDQVRTFATEELGIPFHTTFEALEGEDPSQMIPHPADMHYDARGNELIGRHLAERLAPTVETLIERVQ